MKKNYLFILVFSLFLLSCNFKSVKNKDENLPPKQEIKPLVLIFAGDVMNHMPQSHAAYNSHTDSYDYKPCFQFIKPYIETADLSFCNLELPLAGKPYSGYPQFSGPDEMLDAIQWTGFDVVQMANNHIMDRGNTGNQRTINEIKKRNLKFVGSYAEKEQKDSIYPLIITKNKVKIAILNYSYGLNMYMSRPSIVNIFDSTLIKNDIQKLKFQNIDFIIATVHWGNEYELKRNDIQKKWANFLIKNGVDLIVGSHPHVVQNFEIEQFNGKNIPIFYSLGNFTSNQREKNKNGGILARVEIDTRHKTVKNVSYLPFYLLRGVLDKKFQYYLLPTDEYILNHSLYPISKNDSVQLIDFHTQTKETLKDIPSYYERF